MAIETDPFKLALADLEELKPKDPSTLEQQSVVGPSSDPFSLALQEANSELFKVPEPPGMLEGLRDEVGKLITPIIAGTVEAVGTGQDPFGVGTGALDLAAQKTLETNREAEILAAGDPFEQAVVDASRQRPPLAGWQQVAGEALQRSGYRALAARQRLMGVGAELGDESILPYEAEASRLEAQATKPHFQSYFEDVYDTESFAKYAVEKFGENAANMGLAIVGGGVGGTLGRRMVGRRMMLSKPALDTVTITAAQAGAYPLVAGLEIADTAQEQFEVSSSAVLRGEAEEFSYNPQVAIPAGLLKGVVELFTETRLLKGFGKGGGVLRTTGRTALQEAGEEIIQEQIDIVAREITDPNHTYFSRDMVMRTAESGIAGGVVGGGLGAVVSGVDRVVSGKPAEATPWRGSGDVAKQRPEALRDLEVAQQMRQKGGPLTLLRSKYMGVKGPGADNHINMMSASEDVTEMQVAVAPFYASLEAGARSLREVYALSSIVDDNTPRFVVRNPASGGFDNTILTSTDVERVLSGRGTLVSAPEIFEVDMATVLPGAITATLGDLPLSPNDRRIYFLPGTSQAEIAGLQQQYFQLQTTLGETAGQRFGAGAHIQRQQIAREHYQRLLDSGLRVIPNVGASFYYNGPVAGKPVAEPRSKRTMHVFAVPASFEYRDLEIVGNPGTILAPPHNVNLAQEVPLALDMEKIASGQSPALITLITPQHVSDLTQLREQSSFKLRYPSNLSFDEALAKVNFEVGFALPLNSKPTMELYRAGIYIEYDPLDVLAAAVLTREIPVEAFTFGYQVPPRVYEINPASSRLTHRPSTARAKRPAIEIYRPAGATTEAVQQADKVVAVIQRLHPVLARVYAKAGIKVPPQFVITTEHDGSTQAHLTRVDVQTGIIIIPAWAMLQPGYYNKAMSLEIDVFASVMHEIGHIVTYQAWQKLPLAIKEAVYAGYKRALFNYRLTQQKSTTYRMYDPRVATGFSNVDVEYYFSFSEYLAEMFRRWATTDASIVEATEQFYSVVGHQLKELHKVYVQELGAKHAQNLMKSDYSFNTMMEYLEQTAYKPTSPMQMMASFRALAIDYKLPVELDAIEVIVQQELAKLGRVIPAGISVTMDRSIEIRDDGSVGWIGEYDANARTLRLLLGSLAYEDNIPFTVRRLIAHESSHAVESVYTNEEWTLLVEAGKRNKVLTTEQLARYYRSYKEMLIEGGMVEEREINESLKYLIEAEYVAFMIDSRVDGKTFGTTVDQLLDMVIQLLERIYNGIRGLGFKTVDDVIRAFYRGEIARRLEQETGAANKIVDQLMAFQPGYNYTRNIKGATKLADDLYALRESPDDIEGNTLSDRVLYTFLDQPNASGFSKVKATLSMRKDPKGWDVVMIKVVGPYHGQGLPEKMIEHAQRDLGEELKVSGVLTNAGYKMIKRVRPELVKHYVKVEDLWYSPNHIKEQYDLAKTHPDQVPPGVMRRAEEIIASFPPEYFADPKNLKQFMLSSEKKWLAAFNRIPAVAGNARDSARREMEMAAQARAISVDEAQYVTAVTGETLGPQVDDFTQDTERETRAQIAERAQRYEGEVTSVASEQPETALMAGVFDWYKRGQNDPEVARVLEGIELEADKISKISKNMFGIHQIVWRNPKIFEAREHLSLTERQNAKMQEWIAKADAVVRAWDKLPKEQRDKVTDLLFWATEMRYRTPAEIAKKVNRHPTNVELQAEFRRTRMSQQATQVFADVQNSFLAFLNDVERVSLERITRTVSNPLVATAAIADVQASMAKLRAKPYFPMARLGKYSLTARDSNNKVVWFSLYVTRADRDAATKQYAAQNLGHKLRIAQVPEAAQEFMGIPPILLQQIKANLPNISAVQADWIDQFSILNAPETSFRKRWLERKGTPGYSLDGMRVYGHYFQSGAKYLARIEFKDQIQNNINQLQDTVPLAKDGEKRQQLVDALQEHANYLAEGGRDWVKFKSLVAVWYLGGSVVAAAMNLTQVPVYTRSFLASHFGEVKTTAKLLRTANVLRPTFGLPPIGTSQGFLKAREEAKAQGKIDTGQASELASLTEGGWLSRTFAGSEAQRAWRQFSWWYMVLFSGAEKFNREWTFRAAYELALENPTNSHIVDMQLWYIAEINQLIAKRGLSLQEATAFVFAREAIDRTHFIYNAYARPKFLRGRVPGALQVFYSYTQSAIFSMLPGQPGAAKIVLALLFLYGVKGLPGAEEWDKLINLIARRRFGKDFSVEKEARTLVRDMTRGTVFDEVAPDLLMHGVSRFGFGLGFLPDGLGVPRFDASANGSMGKIVPGLYPVLRGFANHQKWKDMTTDVLQDVSGAGFGPMFSWMQMANSPQASSDWRKWERLLPRAIKAMSKSVRYASDGREITSSGATFAKFDMNDPDDRATVIAQFLGFTPEKVSAKWEAISASQDLTSWLQHRKLELYSQMDYAVQQKDQDAIQDVAAGIARFNEEMKGMGFHEMGISNPNLRRSLQQRENARDKQEKGLPNNKAQIPVRKEVFDLYPRAK